MTGADEPQRIVAALVAAGWEVEDRDTCVWLTYRGLPDRLVLVKDPGRDVYEEQVQDIVDTLSTLEIHGKAATQALETLTAQGVIV